MDLKKEFEERFKKIEELIEQKGVGSSPLKKAKKVQKAVNLGLFVGSLITVAGVTYWLFNRKD